MGDEASIQAAYCLYFCEWAIVLARSTHNYATRVHDNIQSQLYSYMSNCAGMITTITRHLDKEQILLQAYLISEMSLSIIITK